MKVVEMPAPKTEQAKEDRIKECSERIYQVLAENKVTGFMFFGIDQDGNMISNGLGMQPQDLALVSLLVGDMAKHAISTRIERQ
jgi:sulfur transfer protein SufE